MSVRVLRGAGVCRAAVTGHRGAAARRAVATGAARPAAVHLTGDVGVTRRCGPGARAVHATRRAAQQEGEGAVGGRHDPAIRQVRARDGRRGGPALLLCVCLTRAAPRTAARRIRGTRSGAA